MVFWIVDGGAGKSQNGKRKIKFKYISKKYVKKEVYLKKYERIFD